MWSISDPQNWISAYINATQYIKYVSEMKWEIIIFKLILRRWIFFDKNFYAECFTALLLNNFKNLYKALYRTILIVKQKVPIKTLFHFLNVFIGVFIIIVCSAPGEPMSYNVVPSLHSQNYTEL